MTKHTAETLKYYLGKEVLVVDNECREQIKGKLFEINIKNEITKVCEGVFVGVNWVCPLKCNSIYPILKTHSLHKDPYDPISETYSKLYSIIDITLDEALELLENDYGAIENEESETGYLDLFGMPCVTPEQVEEGFINK